MNTDITINFRNQSNVRRLGMAALIEKIGNVGAVYFIRQFETGSGDYTKEREALHADLSFDEIIQGSIKMDKKRKSLCLAPANKHFP